MGLLVLAFPEISKDNFNFIQKFRKDYDRHYPVFPPHFTLVFPVYDEKENEFISHVIDRTKNFKKIDFELNCAITVKDSFSEYTDILLVPDKGHSSIIKMHDALYKGMLVNHLRIDIPFIPHMTIGNDADQFHCINLANDLNEADISISGVISKLTVARYNGTNVDLITDISLN